jgi:hypothetical protein
MHAVKICIPNAGQQANEKKAFLRMCPGIPVTGVFYASQFWMWEENPGLNLYIPGRNRPRLCHSISQSTFFLTVGIAFHGTILQGLVKELILF